MRLADKQRLQLRVIQRGGSFLLQVGNGHARRRILAGLGIGAYQIGDLHARS